MRSLGLLETFILAWLASCEALSLTSVAAPPPLNSPVFSLATVSADGSTDMNIITYASPVGIRPVRKWVVSLYKKTLTHENLIGGFDHNKKPNVAVLQLLRKKHEPLVYPLGGQSGRDIDKAALCAEKGFEWVEPNEAITGLEHGDGDEKEEENTGGVFEVGSCPMLLPGCAAYYRVSLEKASAAPHHPLLFDAGDHEVALLTIDRVVVEHREKEKDEDEEGDDEGNTGFSFNLPGEKHMSTSVLRRNGVISDAGRALPPTGH